ncbi:hypothetical protein LTR37_006116 [Vermiconidia calcicola]|uniref:Uncharacterized protein n=1 Tax=Vermiconidia calcicola TaxID=1690605 RepID=A0ACC3NIV6_9PEZI|nr:hypothetical protein LTR37_006116 [Vermiconidia calcicola]
MHYSSKMVVNLLSLLITTTYALPTTRAANISTVEAREDAPWTGVYICNSYRWSKWGGSCQYLPVQLETCVAVPEVFANSIRSIGADLTDPPSACSLKSGICGESEHSYVINHPGCPAVQSDVLTWFGAESHIWCEAYQSGRDDGTCVFIH